VECKDGGPHVAYVTVYNSCMRCHPPISVAQMQAEACAADAEYTMSGGLGSERRHISSPLEAPRKVLRRLGDKDIQDIRR